jgi:hypothetical protein
LDGRFDGSVLFNIQVCCAKKTSLVCSCFILLAAVYNQPMLGVFLYYPPPGPILMGAPSVGLLVAMAGDTQENIMNCIQEFMVSVRNTTFYFHSYFIGQNTLRDIP